MKDRRWIGSALALACGLAIAWIDTRPGWDDTGITAGAVLLASAVSALVGAPIALAAALVVVPMLVAELSGGMGVLLAVPFAVAGAVGGWLARRLTLGRS